jgi:hypothetical protein
VSMSDRQIRTVLTRCVFMNDSNDE